MAYYLKTTAVVRDVDTDELINDKATIKASTSSRMSLSLKTFTNGVQLSYNVSSYYQYFGAYDIDSDYEFDHFEVNCPSRISYPTSVDFDDNPTGQWSFYYNASSCQSSSTALVLTVTLYLKSAAPATATLSYNANGGSSTPSSQTAEVGDTITLAAAITRSGYTFVGWKIGSSTYAAGASYTLSANATAVAQWSQTVTYIVSFDKTYSDVTGDDVPSIVATQGNQVVLPTAGLWQRSGYAFVGWSLTSGGTAQYFAGDSYAPTANVTFYAVWSSTSGSGARTPTYSTSSSSSSGTTLSSTAYSNGYKLKISSNLATETLALSYWTRTLGSWVNKHYSYDPTQAVNPTVTTTNVRSQGSDSNLTGTVPVGSSAASGTPSNLSLQIPGDYISYYWYQRDNSSSQYYTANDTTRECSVDSDWTWTVPELENYEFDGWYTLDQCYAFGVTFPNTNGCFTTKIGSDRTINFRTLLGLLNHVCTSSVSTGTTESYDYDNYVQIRYVGKKILVLFDACGGELDDFYRDVRYAAAYGSLPVPTRSGYTFDGWFTAASGGTEVTASTIVTNGSSHTLYAHWTKASEAGTLYFMPTGGTCSETSRDITEGTAYGSLPTPTRTGYTFLGWFTLPSGGTEVTASTVAGAGDAYVYARWRGAACTVTFDANGGTCAEATRTVYAGEVLGALPTATKSGCKLDGWFTSGGTQANASTVVSSSIALTARWSAGSSTRVIVRYKIKLTLNGGTLAASYECKYTRGIAKALPTASEITRSGYTFGGWYASSDFSGSAATEIPASESGTKTFYAKWN